MNVSLRYMHIRIDEARERGNEITFSTTIGGGKHNVKQYDPKEIHCPQHQLLLMIALQVFITTSPYPTSR